MSAELQAHGKLMGGVRAATRTQKLKVPKSVQKRIDKAERDRKAKKSKEETSKAAPKENETSITSDVLTKKEEPKFVASERTNAPSEPRPIEASRQWKENGY